ncbi:MAG: malate:quinone oxidoreductase [Candidatus Carsonella ruddii]
MFNIVGIVGTGIVGAISSFMINLILKNKILVFEINNKVSIENSKTTNNAGTGHEGMCENNYIKIKNNKYLIIKNIRIYNKFVNTKNFFSWIFYFKIFNFKNIISKTIHISYFFFKFNIKLLKIFNKIKIFNNNIIFNKNNYYNNKISSLIIKKKKIKKNFSISLYKYGFDINYQYLSIKIFNFLTKQKKIFLFLNCNIYKINNFNKKIKLFILKKKTINILLDKIIICSGGSSLQLLKTNNNYVKNIYYELPINGTWLINEERKIIKKHNLKIYSESLKNNPPMSIPHLDIRKIYNENKILFGPYAGLTFKILINKKKNITENINFKHIFDLLYFSYKNKTMIKYLFIENLKTKNSRINNIFPFCKIIKNIYYKKAGKRLQILKKQNKKIRLIFGTKLIFNKNNNIITLLGASPGASIIGNIVDNIIKKWFLNKNFFINYKKKKKNKIFNNIIFERN